jgi:acetylornithine deacetylase/succinyl-diaminopimelate desuccinylase-like protein
VEAHLAKHGWFAVREEPDAALRLAHEKIVRVEWGSGYPAQRTAMDLPLARALIDAVRAATGDDLVLLPSMGGSLPMYLFEEVLGAPPISVPIVNHDNNQHAANENVRLGNLWDGIEIYAALLARFERR